MSAPVRFLLVAIAFWVLLRGAIGAILPDFGALAVEKAGPAPALDTGLAANGPVSEPVPADVPPPEYHYGGYYPAGAAYAAAPAYPNYQQGYAPYPQPVPRYLQIPVYYPTYAPIRTPAPSFPESEPALVAPGELGLVPHERQPGSSDLAQNIPPSTPDWFGQPQPSSRSILAKLLPQKHLDRLQLSAWGLLRGAPGTGSLAGVGTLGGSQAGARLTYALDQRIALSLRSSSPIGGSRGGEVAGGLRLTPFPSVPLAVTAERRQAIGRFSTGRSDFALFAEGGLYRRPVAWGLMLDGYAQAGLVGLKERDVFADGGFTLSRPVIGRFSLGLGAWGGYQPGIYRMDAGPRLSLQVRPNVSLHLDWRQRLAGAALPSSGPALGLGANF